MCEKNEYEELLSKLFEPKSGLIDRYWDDYEDYVKHKDMRFIVNPSIPIIWFGNLKAYCKSPLQVVTVGLNPSYNEFPDTATPRFGEAEKLINRGHLNENEKRILITSYNEYFHNNPYPDYFSSYERVLQNLPITASYGDPGQEPIALYGVKQNKEKYRKHKCTAIHIDSETAIATKYFWEAKETQFEDTESYIKFKDEVKPTLSKKGNGLFDDFLRILAPDVILFSSRPLRDNKVKWMKKEILESESFHEKKKVGDKEVNNYRVSYRIDGKLWIYGRNNQINPFLLPSQKDPKAHEHEIRFFEKSFSQFGINF